MTLQTRVPTSATIAVYSVPIGDRPGAWAHHTYAYATKDDDTTYNFPCHGSVRIPGDGDIPIITGLCTDMERVSAMVSMSSVLQPVYAHSMANRCGLIYGVTGVCHQMTNRILAAALMPLIQFRDVKGYQISNIVYGWYGGTNFYQRLTAVDCIISPAAGAVGSGVTDQIPAPIFDPLVFDDHHPSWQKIIADTKDRSLRRMLQMELYGVSTPESRLSTLYQERLLNGSSAELQVDKRLQSLIAILNVFIKEKDDIAKKYHAATSSPATEKEMLEQINESFVHMNRAMGEKLGADYQQLFSDKFDRDLMLCEYPISDDY